MSCRVSQSVERLTHEAEEVRIPYPIRPHTFVSPSADSRRAAISYWRTYMHEVQVNRLRGLSLPRKSVVSPDRTLAVYRGRKTTEQHLLHVQRKGKAGGWEGGGRGF